MASEDDGQITAFCKSRLIIDATSSSRIPMSEVSDDKP